MNRHRSEQVGIGRHRPALAGIGARISLFLIKTTVSGEERTSFCSSFLDFADAVKTADKVFFSNIAQYAFKEKSDHTGRGCLQLRAEKMR